MPAGCRRSVSIDWTKDSLRARNISRIVISRDIRESFRYFSRFLHQLFCIGSACFVLILAKRSVIAFVPIIPPVYSIRRRFRLTGALSLEKKNGLWVCDISRSPSRPRPVLLNPEPFSLPLSLAVPSSFFSFSPSRPGPRRSRSCLSLLYLASHGSQLRVLSRGLLGELPARRNGRGFDSGRHGILIRDSDSAISRSRKSGPGRMSLRPMRRPGRSGTFVILMDPVPRSIPRRSILSRPKGRRNLTYLEITAPSPEKDRS